MMRCLCAFAVSLWLAPSGVAADWYVPDIKQKTFEDCPGTVDHLLPLDQTQPSVYYVAEFAAHPSFENGREWQIALAKGQYILRSWESLRAKERGQPRTTANAVEVAISPRIASIVYGMWANTLLDVRYTRASGAGLDGSRYRFSTYLRGPGWLHGTTWSPDDDLPPKWMVETGELIYQFSRAEKRNEAQVEAVLQSQRDRLERFFQNRDKK
jgi:hypothetical protein